MINIQTIDQQYLQNDTIILGSFQTLHLGHQELLKKASKYDNVTLLRINRGFRIFTNIEIKYLIKKYNWNVNNIFDLDFEQIKNISATDFIKILQKNNIKNVICGSDFAFGSNRLGTIEMLKENFNVDVIDLKVLDTEKISTSKIIKKLEIGDIDYFEKTHGFNYFVYSNIIHGDKIGRTIDFPTINSNIENKIVPQFGVYAAIVNVDDKKYVGATYIGRRPTLNKIQTRFETNILDFSKEIYDLNVCIELMKNIRFEMKFNSLDELKTQIRKDVNDVKFWRNNNW